jgi:radical SAM protein with 4Fe4S-binding SPASM domain
MTAASSFRSVLQRTFRENRLFSALLELTYRCNLDCFFCYNDLSLRGRPMATPDWLSLLEDLAGMQVMNLTLSGGEPLAHPDFLRLGLAARELGFVLRVKSNGHALRGTLLRRLKAEVDPYLVELSLHGASAASHDRQTRVSGSFERLLSNLAEMRALGLRAKLNATLTAWNQHEVESMFALADRLGFPLQFDPEVTPRDDGDLSPLQIRPSRDGVLRLLRIEFERGEAAARRAGVAAAALPEPREQEALAPASGGKHCGAGSSGIAVDPFGNVYPCVQWRHKVGNLHEQRIQEIWQGSRALQEVRELAVDVKRTLDREGAAGRLMNFCPGLAAASGGQPTTVYPGARLRAELVAQVQGERKRIPLRVVS